MRKKNKLFLKGSSLVEVLVAFSILGISLGIAALLLNHLLFATLQTQLKKRRAIGLANQVLTDTLKTKTKWVEKDIYCTKNMERVTGSGRIIKVIVRCYEGSNIILEKKAYQEKLP